MDITAAVLVNRAALVLYYHQEWWFSARLPLLNIRIDRPGMVWGDCNCIWEACSPIPGLAGPSVVLNPTKELASHLNLGKHVQEPVKYCLV